MIDLVVRIHIVSALMFCSNLVYGMYREKNNNDSEKHCYGQKTGSMNIETMINSITNAHQADFTKDDVVEFLCADQIDFYISFFDGSYIDRQTDAVLEKCRKIAMLLERKSEKFACNVKNEIIALSEKKNHSVHRSVVLALVTLLTKLNLVVNKLIDFKKNSNQSADSEHYSNLYNCVDTFIKEGIRNVVEIISMIDCIEPKNKYAMVHRILIKIAYAQANHYNALCKISEDNWKIGNLISYECSSVAPFLSIISTIQRALKL